MAELLRRYGVSRGLYRVLMVVSWIALVGGIILAVYGFARSGQLLAMGGQTSMELRWVSATPGVVVLLLGLIGLAVSYVGLAATDAVELAAEQLIMLRDITLPLTDMPPAEPQRPRPAAAPVAHGDDEEEAAAETPAPSPAARPTRQAAQPRPERGEERLIETYQGVEIYERYNGTYIGERWFANLSAAKAYIDVSKGS